MNYTCVTIRVKDPETIEILIALLADIGFESFEEEGPVLNAYIPSGHLDIQALNSVLQDFDLTFSTEEIEQRNWNADWESTFSPVRVGDFCTVRASFHSPDTETTHEIVITPKMSFGTGHHATTRLMVEQMRHLDFAGKVVLDFGTGTGVLAILAERLGAQGIVAIDNDQWSIENVQENIQQNQTKGIAVLQGSLETVADRQFDIILANINRHILVHYMPMMSKILCHGGQLLVSGILEEDIPLMTSEALRQSLLVHNSILDEKWACMLLQKPADRML